MSTPEISYLSVEEYLLWEKNQSTRHEYVDGQIFAMGGATRRHRLLVGNIYNSLRALLRGSSCSAEFLDAKVHIEATNSFYYPDIVVSCGEVSDSAVLVENPVLIVEVLSRSTASIDRREKLFAYRRIESLEEYLIVHQRRQRVELHRKLVDGSWTKLEFLQGQIVLESILGGKFSISMDSIYEDVRWADHSGQVKESEASYELNDENDW
ncbi:MAG: Uma2 family endonuclease [Candidatus Obscuribacterales bacterium]|nr:Uma2 family endonuclease [Candidatus Obscuribacterales bacterium]